MPSENKKKLELLVRRNEGKREHPYYLTEISHVLKHPIGEVDLLDLDKTDQLFSEYTDHSRKATPDSSLKKIWPHHPSLNWIRVCFCLAEQLGSEEVILFAGPYTVCGAVRTKAEYPLVNAASVLAFDRDTVMMQSLNSDSGFYLDLYEENSAWWIELKIWGEWRLRANNCFLVDYKVI
jgi:hypothetical protein